MFILDKLHAYTLTTLPQKHVIIFVSCIRKSLVMSLAQSTMTTNDRAEN